MKKGGPIWAQLFVANSAELLFFPGDTSFMNLVFPGAC